jgi:hypothetical protein
MLLPTLCHLALLLLFFAFLVQYLLDAAILYVRTTLALALALAHWYCQLQYPLVPYYLSTSVSILPFCVCCSVRTLNTNSRYSTPPEAFMDHDYRIWNTFPFYLFILLSAPADVLYYILYLPRPSILLATHPFHCILSFTPVYLFFAAVAHPTHTLSLSVACTLLHL